jgi:hypothetical protein
MTEVEYKGGRAPFSPVSRFLPSSYSKSDIQMSPDASIVPETGLHSMEKLEGAWAETDKAKGGSVPCLNPDQIADAERKLEILSSYPEWEEESEKRLKQSKFPIL